MGAAEFDQTASRYDPRKFWADLYVHRDASTNTGMLAINRRLGYVARSAYIDFVLKFDAA